MYKINYDMTGKPINIQRDDGACIPFEPLNRDFRKFLEWNQKQKKPLDYEKSIKVEPVVIESLEEKITRIVKKELKK